MAFSAKNRQGTIRGIIFVSIFAAAATMFSEMSFFKSLGI